MFQRKPRELIKEWTSILFPKLWKIGAWQQTSPFYLYQLTTLYYTINTVLNTGTNSHKLKKKLWDTHVQT